MATRSAKLYQGEDLAPIIDYTDDVIWEESEFGTRAWQGEGSASTVVIRDELGEQGNSADLPSGLTSRSLASKNLFVIDLDGDIMFRGRVGIKNYSRDEQLTERYRQVEVSLHDTHWDLGHIFVHNYARPSETGNARIQGVMASYLSGSPRPTTDLNGSNFLSGSNTITLEAQTFQRSTPLDIIRDTALAENKQFFITGDTVGGGSMFYDGNDSTVYAAGIRISDRADEVNTDGSCAVGDAPVIVEVADRTSQDTPDLFGTTTPSDDDVNSAFVVWVWHRRQDKTTQPHATVVWRPEGTSDPGNTEAFTHYGTAEVVLSGNDVRNLEIHYLVDPTGSMGVQSDLLIEFPSFNPMSWGYYYLTNVDPADPLGTLATNTGTGSSSSLTISDAGVTDLVLNAAGAGLASDWNPAANPTEGGGQTADMVEFNNASFGVEDTQFGAGHGSTAPTWTWASSQQWAAAGVAVHGATGGEGAPTFPPIWNVGPASTEDGSEQLCEVVLFYGAGTDQYVTAHNLTVHTQYGHSSETFTDDTIVDATEAQRRANSILTHRQYEDKTYNVTVGPLRDDQVLCVRHGQTIYIKARAIPDADDQFRLMRIVQCRYTTPVIGVWFAHLQLGRPWKIEPYGTGSGLTPPASGAASDTTPEPIGVEGSAGTDSGEYADATHVHAHGTISDIPGGTAHPAADVSIADAGAYFTGTDVEAALQELGAGGGGGGMTNPMTSIGDLIRGGAAGAPTRLPIGGSNTRLASDGSVPLWVPADTSGGGGGATMSRIGTTSVGGSSEQSTTHRQYAKLISVPGEGMIRSVVAYLQPRSSGATPYIGAAVWTDNGGAFDDVIGGVGSQIMVLGPNAVFTNAHARWIHVPVNVYVAAAGDYWIGIRTGGTSLNLFYAASGTDRISTPGGDYIADGDYYAQSAASGGRDYSLYAVFEEW